MSSMSERYKEARNAALVTTGLIIMRAVSVGASVVLEGHYRGHGRVETSGVAKEILNANLRSVNFDPLTWIDNHEQQHHRRADQNHKPYLDTYRRVTEARQRDLLVPDEFQGLDPIVEAVPLSAIDQIGPYLIEDMQTTMGDEYVEPSFDEVSDEDLLTALSNDEPQYYYPLDPKDDIPDDGEYTQEQVERILLRDQHSLLFEPPKNPQNPHNPARKLMFKNLGRNDVPTLLKKRCSQYLQEGRRPDSNTTERSNKAEMVGAYAVYALLAFGAMRCKHLRDIPKAAAIGAVATTLGSLANAAGSAGVNVYGHLGADVTPKRIAQATFGSKFDIRPNEDGTFASNPTGAGRTGETLGVVLMGEANQEAHHKDPDQSNPPSSRDGIDPWGRLFDWAARSRSVPGIKPGQGMPPDSGGRRPDMPCLATEIIQELRALTPSA